jgi:Ca2+/Na+ antiporter
MSRNVGRAAASSAARRRKKSRRTSLLVVLASIAVVITLIATEQVAILYVLATLGIAVLLVVVAMADLRGARQATEQAPPYDDAASIGDGRTGAASSTTFGSTTPRAVRNRGGR